ncbi:GNAT family N-acetyltransferase [Chelativorans sp. Marseille-P2723]|uniref:GNAT family N-acetyltransferase n=1 Tax=Chelativorans sp. Marseille-P2723 TaxID=2709133 RepID=UPI001FEED76E|nr:GNAT family N-acetyltransferase [Chelativorans sp. Marseille-P2723]
MNETIERLAAIRRFEAAGFRAWPAGSVLYDGTWAVRLTKGHPSYRLNSVNPLDPGDTRDLPGRIERAAQRFNAFDRPLTFRLTPLAATSIAAYLDAEGWLSVKSSTVMRLSLSEKIVGDAMDQIPLKDLDRFIAAAFRVHDYAPELRSGFAEVVGAIKPEKGLFVLEQDDRPVSAAICVHDGALAGIFELSTAEPHRCKGYGRRVLLSALKWAYLRGATIAWLQVHDTNEPARNLYRSLGFEDVYQYHYRQPPKER